MQEGNFISSYELSFQVWDPLYARLLSVVILKTLLCRHLNQQAVPQVCFTFPHNQYLLKVTDSDRETQPACVQPLWGLRNVKMSPGDCKCVHSFLSSRLVWLLNIKGLSGAVKRAYCYIPALTTATGFPLNNNKQLILLNSQTFTHTHTHTFFGDKTLCLQFLQTQTGDKC